MSDEQDSVKVNLTLREGDGEIVLRQVALGYQPIIVIEPIEVGDDVEFSMDVTGLDQAELVDILELMLSVLNEGAEE